MKATSLFVLMVMSGGLLMGQDASELQAALNKARNQQAPAPTAPPNAQKPTGSHSSDTIEIPIYHPGKSKLFKVSDVAALAGQGELSDCWIYGKFTVFCGGVQSHSLIGALPAGAMSASTLGGLLGVQYIPTMYSIGWLIKDETMPTTEKNTVIVISQNDPASLKKVLRFQGKLAVEVNLVKPPEAQK